MTYPAAEKKRACIKGTTGPRLVLQSVECVEVTVQTVTLIGRKVSDPETADVVRTTGDGRLTMTSGIHTLHLVVDGKSMKYCLPHSVCVMWMAE